MSFATKAVPLVAPGHTRPVTHLSFSVQESDGSYFLVSSCKDGNPMLRDWRGDWIGTFVGHKGAVWCTKLSLDGSKAVSGSADFTAYVSIVLNYKGETADHVILSYLAPFRKCWDAYTGLALHSFPHNHIVRSVALSPSSDRILTGGQEKKARIFDLGKPDAAPDFLGGDATTTCHEGTIRSTVWVSESVTVTAGEDGFVKCVVSPLCLKRCMH